MYFERVSRERTVFKHGGEGGAAIEAKGGCRLVLPGVRTRSPFEEGIPHSWMGGLVVHPLNWGRGALGYPPQPGRGGGAVLERSGEDRWCAGALIHARRTPHLMRRTR